MGEKGEREREGDREERKKNTSNDYAGWFNQLGIKQTHLRPHIFTQNKTHNYRALPHHKLKYNSG